mmetsp:Transcript_2293/g.4214  ORF Transcript_2293/g.4214 Transcript_2293/m.4214 type:complete len:308 (+) Transcript_2293:7195-8118(+)
MPAVAFLPPHHHPRRPPLSQIYRFDHLGNFIHERNSPRHVIQHWNRTDILPRHRHILQQFKYRMRDVLQSPQIHPLIGRISFGRHIPVVRQDLPHVLGRKEFFLRGGHSGAAGVEGGETTAVRVAFGLELGPSFGFFFESERGWLRGDGRRCSWDLGRLLVVGVWVRGKGHHSWGGVGRNDRHARGCGHSWRWGESWRDHSRWSHARWRHSGRGHTWRSHARRHHHGSSRHPRGRGRRRREGLGMIAVSIIWRDHPGWWWWRRRRHCEMCGLRKLYVSRVWSSSQRDWIEKISWTPIASIEYYQKDN